MARGKKSKKKDDPIFEIADEILNEVVDSDEDLETTIADEEEETPLSLEMNANEQIRTRNR